MRNKPTTTNQHVLKFSLTAFAAVILAITVTALLMSYTIVKGHIDSGEQNGHRPRIQHVRVMAFGEPSALKFLEVCRNDAKEQEKVLISQVQEEATKAGISMAQASQSKPLDELSKDKLFNAAVRGGMDVMTGGLWEVTRNMRFSAGNQNYDLEKATWRLNNFPVAGFYFLRLPQSPVAEALTDQNGDFSMILPKHKKFLIAAQTSTETANWKRPGKIKNERRPLYTPPDQQCYWLLWHQTSADQSLVLSKDNMTNSQIRENALPASCYDYWGESNR